MDSRELLENQLRNIFGRVAYSHKTHEKRGEFLHSCFQWISFAQIVFSSFATVGFLTVIFNEGEIFAIISASLSVVILILSTCMLSFNFAERAQVHRSTAAQLWFIREKYLSLINDLRMEQDTVENIAERRDELLMELHKVYSEAPNTDGGAYRKAQKALQKNEELTFSDREINHLLPSSLRKDVDAKAKNNDATS